MEAFGKQKRAFKRQMLPAAPCALSSRSQFSQDWPLLGLKGPKVWTTGELKKDPSAGGTQMKEPVCVPKPFSSHTSLNLWPASVSFIAYSSLNISRQVVASARFNVASPSCVVCRDNI